MAAIAALGTMGTMSAVGTLFSTFASIKGAQAQKDIYNAQAAQAQLQGKVKATEYKMQAAKVLRGLNENLSMTVARAAVGGDPLSGSPLTLQEYARREAGGEYIQSKDNAILALSNADVQAGIYKQAGQQAMYTGYANAIGTATTGMYQALKIG